MFTSVIVPVIVGWYYYDGVYVYLYVIMIIVFYYIWETHKKLERIYRVFIYNTTFKFLELIIL